MSPSSTFCLRAARGSTDNEAENPASNPLALDSGLNPGTTVVEVEEVLRPQAAGPADSYPRARSTTSGALGQARKPRGFGSETVHLGLAPVPRHLLS